MKKVSWLPLSVFLFLCFPPALRAVDNDTCLACHGQDLPGVAPVDHSGFSKSVHGKLECSACHTDAQEIPHSAKPGPVSCRQCHRLETEIYMKSDHGRALSRGRSEAATCTSCHGGAHAILSYRNSQSPVFRTNLPKTCASCHADIEKMQGIRLTEKEPFETYVHSVHGEALKGGKMNAAICSDCHGTHDLHSASNPLSKIYRTHIPNTCGKCHENVSSVYKMSIHGKALEAGIKEVPVCTDCHGEHTIRAISNLASPVYAGAITRTCSGCHESEQIIEKFDLPTNRLASYQNSYHGLASRLGDLHAANCASCHGWHDILPSSDPRSSIYPGNLAQTCGKCHSGAQVKLLSGKVHGSDTRSEQPVIHWVKLFYLLMIPFTLGFMLLHNLSDYLRKALSSEHERIPEKELQRVRLSRNERWQHGVFAMAFIILAVTGFALEYPDSWWAIPLSWGGEAFRKNVHRAGALVLCLTGVWHILYMMFTKRGRFLLRHKLMPRLHDLMDPLNMLMFNLGWRRTRPVLRYPSYIARIEYWALIWGSMVMILSGSVLVFNDFALRHWPYWVSNLATLVHFYEAILACLAILVWHFYWTIFDPEIYPMNWAWLFGKLKPPSKNRKPHDH